MADTRPMQLLKTVSLWISVWKKMEDDLLISTYAGIPHTREAIKARDKVLSLGASARESLIAIVRTRLSSSTPTSFGEIEPTFDKYREALDEVPGLDIVEGGGLKRLLARLYRYISKTEECDNVVQLDYKKKDFT